MLRSGQTLAVFTKHWIFTIWRHSVWRHSRFDGCKVLLLGGYVVCFVGFGLSLQRSAQLSAVFIHGRGRVFRPCVRNHPRMHQSVDWGVALLAVDDEQTRDQVLRSWKMRGKSCSFYINYRKSWKNIKAVFDQISGTEKCYMYKTTWALGLPEH